LFLLRFLLLLFIIIIIILLSFFPRDMNESAADLRNYWTEFHDVIQIWYVCR
jgi:hypothetical protein